MKYDPVMCMMVEDTKKANDSECKELTMDSEEYNNWLSKNETEASNENLVKYLVEVKGFTKENAKKYAKGRIHDAMNKAITICDSRVSTRNVVTSNIAF